MKYLSLLPNQNYIPMFSSGDMSKDRKSCYISYLVDCVNETELDKKTLELVLEDFPSAWNHMKAELAELQRRQNEMGFQTTGVSL